MYICIYLVYFYMCEYNLRLFWTDDKRFHKQFKAGQLTKFKSYSK